jgi:hypothetical protein
MLIFIVSSKILLISDNFFIFLFLFDIIYNRNYCYNQCDNNHLLSLIIIYLSFFYKNTKINNFHYIIELYSEL